MGHRVPDQIVDLLESRPDPLRGRLRLVRDVHADQSDGHCLRSALGVRNDRLGGKEPARLIAFADVDDFPGEFEFGRPAPIDRVGSDRKL